MGRHTGFSLRDVLFSADILFSAGAFRDVLFSLFSADAAGCASVNACCVTVVAVTTRTDIHPHVFPAFNFF